MKLHALFLIVAPLASASALAADVEGAFSIRGAGLLTCEVYTEQRAERSNAYLMIGGWIDGYITARNQFEQDTYDVTSYESTELLAAIIDNHCQNNPEDRLFAVVNSIFVKLGGERIRERSPFVTAEIDGREARLYRETVRRLQSKLMERGLYSGEINGLLSDATIAAIRGYQDGVPQFEATGFPDQTTLWSLLTPPDP